MDFRAGIGSLSCRLCGASYQMPIHHLHEPVDVFSEWLDDCEAAAQGKPTGASAGGASSQQSGGGDAGGPPQYESDSDDDLGAPSGLTGTHSNKTAAAAAGASNNDTAGGSGAAAPNYEALGLGGDSDDDSD